MWSIVDRWFPLPKSKALDLGIMHRKGFPESFDYQAIVAFLSSVKSSQETQVPLYSHATYDVVDAGKTIENPDILIIEGLNLLQNDPSDLNGENPTIRELHRPLCLPRCKKHEGLVRFAVFGYAMKEEQ